MAKFLKLMRVK
jgi:hypothetical protein